MRIIARILRDSLPQREVLHQARANRTLRKWREIVGPTLAEKCWPDRYERGTVYVAVTGSAWAQELRMNKDAILRKLAEVSEEPGLFQDLRFGVRPLPVEREAEPPKPQRVPGEPRTIKEIAAKWLGTQTDPPP